MIAPITAVMMDAMNPEPMLMPSTPREPATDQGADNSHNDVAYETEPATLDQPARKPACDCADDQPNDDAMGFHSCLPQIWNASPHSKLKGSATPLLE